jgi:hypothetical protein
MTCYELIRSFEATVNVRLENDTGWWMTMSFDTVATIDRSADSSRLVDTQYAPSTTFH